MLASGSQAHGPLREERKAKTGDRKGTQSGADRRLKRTSPVQMNSGISGRRCGYAARRAERVAAQANCHPGRCPGLLSFTPFGVCCFLTTSLRSACESVPWVLDRCLLLTDFGLDFRHDGRANAHTKTAGGAMLRRRQLPNAIMRSSMDMKKEPKGANRQTRVQVGSSACAGRAR